MIFKALNIIFVGGTWNTVVRQKNIIYDGDFCILFSENIMFQFLINYYFAAKFCPINKYLLGCINSILLLIKYRSVAHWKEIIHKN